MSDGKEIWREGEAEYSAKSVQIVNVFLLCSHEGKDRLQSFQFGFGARRRFSGIGGSPVSGTGKPFLSYFVLAEFLLLLFPPALVSFLNRAGDHHAGFDAGAIKQKRGKGSALECYLDGPG